jgi:hypothetical protein
VGSKRTVETQVEFLPEDTCSVCGSEYDEDAGGIQGYFGICPVTFCEWCYSSIVDMVSKEISTGEDHEQQKG